MAANWLTLKQPLSTPALAHVIVRFFQDNDKGAGGMDDDKKNMGDDDGGDANETEVGDDEGNGDEGEGEGPVNDDLEEKYEEKPMGVEASFMIAERVELLQVVGVLFYNHAFVV